jgi:hypothetical protein
MRRRALPPAASVQEKIDDIARPGIQLGGSHRDAEPHGAALRQPDDHMQELLRGEHRAVHGEIPRARLALERTRNQSDRFFARALFGDNRCQLREATRFRDDHSMQRDRRRRQGRAKNELRQSKQDLREIRSLKQGHTRGRAKSLDRAVHDRAEHRGLVLEAMIERSLRYPGAVRDRLNGGGAVAQREEQLCRRVDDAMSELLGVGLRRAAAAARDDAGFACRSFPIACGRAQSGQGRARVAKLRLA